MRGLAARNPDVIEQMDGPDADPGMLAKTYARFRLVNAIVSGERAVYRRWVRPRLSPVWGTRLLDVGTGSADLPRRMLRWARDDGLRLDITAIDPDARAIAWAAGQPYTRGLTVRRVATGDLVEAGERFQIVLRKHRG